MAVDSPKPASRGRTSRVQVAGRLTALVGLPVLLIFVIFSSGLYCGASRSYRVRTLEAKWLGMAPPPGSQWEPETPEPSTGEPEPPEPSTGEPETPEPSTGEPEPPEPLPLEPETPEPETPEPLPPETPEPETPEPTQLPIAKADPVGPELRSRFDEVLVLRVKLVVDPALVIARDDWLSYSASLIAASRASFGALFGVEVQLQGVVIWDMAAGADAEALLADLATREREGADIVLGLVARAQPSDFTAAQWTGDQNGDHALVFADLVQTDRYYHNLLRTLAELLGAEAATDPASKALGSFMSDTGPPSAAAPALDPENRGKVIINKRRSFTDSTREAAPEPEPEPKPAKEEI